MARKVLFTIPPGIFPLIQQAVANRQLVPEGFVLSDQVVLQFEPKRRSRGARSPEDPYELLPNGIPLGIQTALVDALGVDEEEINLEASLLNDLGSESIDMLDIIFKLEKAYGIEIPRKDLAPEDILTNWDFVHEGIVNAQGIQALERRMPYADLSQFKNEARVRDFDRYVQTVGFLKRYLEHKGVEFVKPGKRKRLTQ